MAPIKSKVWKAFVRTAGGAKCKLCMCEVKTSGNTTNLIKHLSRRHRNYQYDSNTATVDTETNVAPDSGNNEPQNIDDLDNPRPGTSYEIVDIESDEVDEDNHNESLSTTTFDSAIQRTSYSQPSIKACLANIKSFSESGSKGSQITNGIIYMIVEDNLPLSTTDKEGFKRLMTIVAPLYKIPGRKSVTKMLDDKYDVLASVMKRKLQQVKYFTLTTDIWTETMNTKSFLGLTCHFYFEGQLHSVTFGVAELDDRHTAEYISDTIRKLCLEWDISLTKITAVITDNGKNVVKAVCDLFNKNIHLPCFAHTLDLVASKIINETEGVKTLIDKIKSIVSYFKQSVVAADELRKAQHGGVLKLIQSVPTRWNSTFYMVERFLKLYPYILPILMKYPKSPALLDASEIAKAKEVITVLGPIESVSKEICGEKYLTASKIIPIVNCLRRNLKNVAPSSEDGLALKMSTLSELEKRFGNLEHVAILAMCTILDPRFKKLHFNNHFACAQAINKINDYCLKISNESAATTQGQETDVLERASDKTYESAGTSLWSFHNELAQKLVTEKQGKDDRELNLELKVHLNNPIMPINTDGITFWVDAPKNSVLREVALRYLSVIGTSVPSERLFSKAGQIITQSRNRLTGKRLSKLLFLNSLDVNMWDV